MRSGFFGVCPQCGAAAGAGPDDGKADGPAAALEACGQPVGQLIYGFLFDVCPAGWVLLITGLLMVMLGIIGRGVLVTLKL